MRLTERDLIEAGPMAEKQVLPKSRQNEVFRLVEKASLDPRSFDFREKTFDTFNVISGRREGSYKCSVLHHSDGHFFEFNCDGRSYDPEYSPGISATTEEEQNLQWEEVLEVVKSWLSILKRELNEPDLWSELSKQDPDRIVFDQLNSAEINFTVIQIEQIRIQLDIAKAKIVEKFKPNAEKIDHISSQIDYLVDQASKQTKRDWRNIFIGVIFSIAVSLGIPQQSMPIFITIIQAAFQEIRHLIGM